jgi:hypothetical protein
LREHAGNIGFVENLDNGNPPQWNAPVLLEADGKPIRIMAGGNGSIQGPCEAKWGYTTLSVADWDGDGLNDIIINSIWGKIEWFKNVGTKSNPKLSAQGGVKLTGVNKNLQNHSGHGGYRRTMNWRHNGGLHPWLPTGTTTGSWIW